MVGGIQVWMREKSYVFTPEDLASITTDVLNETRIYAMWSYVNGRGSFTTECFSWGPGGYLVIDVGGGAGEAQQLLV